MCTNAVNYRNISAFRRESSASTTAILKPYAVLCDRVLKRRLSTIPPVVSTINSRRTFATFGDYVAIHPGLPLRLLSNLCFCILLTCSPFTGLNTAAPFQTAPPTSPKSESTDEKQAPSKANKVLTTADFRNAFRGVWAPPSGQMRKSFSGSYGTHEQSIDGKHIYMKGHQKEYLTYGVLLPPEPRITRKASEVPRAKLIEWRKIPAPTNLVDKSGIHQYGFLETEKGLFFTFKPFYAVSGEDFPSQVFVDHDGKVFGCNKLTGHPIPELQEPYHHNKVAGYMCRPPKGIAADYLVGLCGTPGSHKTSAGPSLYAVNFDLDVPPGQSQQALPMIAFNPGPHAMKGWDNVTSIRGAAWIELENRSAVIFTARRSVGHVWYGHDEFDDKKTGKKYKDLINHNKGYHAESYSQGFWIMDPKQALKAYEGKIRPMDVQPVQWIDFKELGVTLDDMPPNGWVTASYRDGRLIVGIEAGFPDRDGLRTPLMLEFQFKD